MKRYEDIERAAKSASQDERLFLNEATIGRNICEMGGTTKFRNAHKFYTIPVMVDGDVVRRMAIYEKSNKPADMDIKLMQGEVYDPEFVVVRDDGLFAAMMREEIKADKPDGNEE